MDKFVCVRIVKTNGMDLSLFQFDYDLTFSVFFMNADKTIYGRYGSRSEMKDAAKDITIDGFRKALAAALEIHKNCPANKASLVGKRGPAAKHKVPEQYPSLRRFKPTLNYEGQVARSCIHCHQVRDAERLILRTARKPIPDKLLYPYPMPDTLGLVLDPKEKTKVKRVLRGSPAEKNGFLPGDELVTLEGQPLISIADVQWILDKSKEPSNLNAEVLRNGRKLKLTLSLAEGWRRTSDISWRPTTWDLRRMGTGGLVLEDLPTAERSNARIGKTKLALRVKYVGQYGAHAAGKRAGFKKGDVIVTLDGRTKHLTETGFLAYVLQNKNPGTRIPITVLREGKRINLNLPMQ